MVPILYPQKYFLIHDMSIFSKVNVLKLQRRDRIFFIFVFISMAIGLSLGVHYFFKKSANLKPHAQQVEKVSVEVGKDAKEFLQKAKEASKRITSAAKRVERFFKQMDTFSENLKNNRLFLVLVVVVIGVVCGTATYNQKEQIRVQLKRIADNLEKKN